MKVEYDVCDICGTKLSDKEADRWFTIPIWATNTVPSSRNPFDLETDIKPKVMRAQVELCDHCAKQIADFIKDNFEEGGVISCRVER